MPFFRKNDIALQVQEPSGNGREGTVICVHPPCLTGRIFAGLEERLGSKRRVIRWNIRGHGASDSGSGKLTLAMIAEDMRLLLDEFGVKQAFVCAYGAGALPTLTALRMYPDRFAGGVLLSGSAGYSDIRSRSGLQAAYVSSILAPKGPIVFKAAWDEAADRTEFEALRDEAGQGDPAKWRDYAAACLDGDSDRNIRQVKQPVLLLYGTKDNAGAGNAAKLRRLLPNCELYGVVGATRQLATKQPITTAFVISQWMDKLRHPELADTYEEREALLRELAEHGVKESGASGLLH